MSDRLLTQREAAERLRVSVERIRHWRYAGKIRGLRLGYRTMRIPESEIGRLLMLAVIDNCPADEDVYASV